MRYAEMTRNTKETQITMSLELDAKKPELNGVSGIGFFDHMLNSFCVHGGFRINMDVNGDLKVDGHHTIEDIGIVLGKLFCKILGDRGGIARFGESFVPMDEALALAVADISGREFLVFDAGFETPRIGDYDTQITEEFFRALANNMQTTLHLKVLYGKNDHHKTEALFKAAARAIGAAVKETSGGVLSTKGKLD